MNERELSGIIVAILKIALMVFSVIHILFLAYLFRRIVRMRDQLSSLKQLPIEGLTLALMLGLIALLVYIIFLPL